MRFCERLFGCSRIAFMGHLQEMSGSTPQAVFACQTGLNHVNKPSRQHPFPCLCGRRDGSQMKTGCQRPSHGAHLRACSETPPHCRSRREPRPEGLVSGEALISASLQSHSLNKLAIGYRKPGSKSSPSKSPPLPTSLRCASEWQISTDSVSGSMTQASFVPLAKKY